MKRTLTAGNTRETNKLPHLPGHWGREALGMHKGHRWQLNLFVIGSLATAVPGVTACKEMVLVEMILATDEILAVHTKAEMPTFLKGWIVCWWQEWGVSTTKDWTGV